MTEQEQIDALKAQVNCLREALTNAAEAPNHTFYYAKEALEVTPDQCLAEVKAKAIEEAIQSCSSSIKYGDMYEAKCLQFYADQLREQAK